MLKLKIAVKTIYLLLPNVLKNQLPKCIENVYVRRELSYRIYHEGLNMIILITVKLIWDPQLTRALIAGIMRLTKIFLRKNKYRKR